MGVIKEANVLLPKAKPHGGRGIEPKGRYRGWLAVDPPSLDIYVDVNGRWTYDGPPEPTSALEWEQVNSQCPQDPWHYNVSR